MIGGLAPFLTELKREPEAAAAATELEMALADMETEALDNRHAQQFLKALRWILAQPRSFREKIVAIDKLMSLRGEVKINSAREFFGWTT